MTKSATAVREAEQELNAVGAKKAAKQAAATVADEEQQLHAAQSRQIMRWVTG